MVNAVKTDRAHAPESHGARRTSPGEMSARTAKAYLHDVLFLHTALWIGGLGYKFALDPSPLKGDWFVLSEVARSFLAGDWNSLYSDRHFSTGTYFFRYPPFVLYFITPLGVLPPMVAYALVCVTQLLAAVVSLWLLFRIRKPAEVRIIIAGVFGSAAMCHVIGSGQNSALLALVIAAATYYWSSGRDALAGVCIGLLACKPNWLPVFGAFVFWRGGLRAGAAFALTAAVLLLSTLPLGVDVWREFFAMTTRVGQIAAGYTAYKEITLLASLRSVLGWTVLAKVLWGISLAVLTALVIRAIRDTRSIGRSVALITLAAVVANPYVSFYDGFVLIVPAILWLAHRDEYPQRAWWMIGALIAAYWFWDMAVFYYKIVVPAFGDPRVSAAGILLTGWLTTEALARPMKTGATSQPTTSPPPIDPVPSFEPDVWGRRQEQRTSKRTTALRRCCEIVILLSVPVSTRHCAGSASRTT